MGFTQEFQCSPSLPRDCFQYQRSAFDRQDNSLFQCSPSLPRDCFQARLRVCAQTVPSCFNVLPRYQGIVSALQLIESYLILGFNVLPRYQGIVSVPLATKIARVSIKFQCSPSLPRDCFCFPQFDAILRRCFNVLPRYQGIVSVKVLGSIQGGLVSMFSLVTKGLFLSWFVMLVFLDTVSMFSLVTKGLFRVSTTPPSIPGVGFNVLPRYQGIVSSPSLGILEQPLHRFQCSPSLPRDCFAWGEIHKDSKKCFNVLPRYQGIVSRCCRQPSLLSHPFQCSPSLPRDCFELHSSAKDNAIKFQCSPSLPRDCFPLVPHEHVTLWFVSMFSLVTKGLFRLCKCHVSISALFQCSPSLPRDCFAVTN